MNINSLSKLPKDWIAQIHKLSLDRGYQTALGGDGSSSRERRPGAQMLVRVSDGLAISERLPWLWDLYVNELLEFSERSFERSLFPANRLESAVNINHLAGKKARYEWHVDTNPVTGLLFVSTLGIGDGGSLVFRNTRTRTNRIVRPKAGLFICFDAREIEHRVAPLKRPVERISVPMNYYESIESQPRPDDLDSKIYSPAL